MLLISTTANGAILYEHFFEGSMLHRDNPYATINISDNRLETQASINFTNLNVGDDKNILEKDVSDFNDYYANHGPMVFDMQTNSLFMNCTPVPEFLGNSDIVVNSYCLEVEYIYQVGNNDIIGVTFEVMGVPEPATIYLVGLGIVCIVGLIRRR